MHAPSPSLFVAVLIACLIVLVLVVFFTATMIRYQRRNLSLYKEKLAAEITTLEKERSRMAEDLHDELGPVLAGIKLKLNSIDVLEERDQVILDKVHQDIAGLINRMKGISNNLMPVVLIKKGLVKAIDNTVEEINQQGDLHISFHADQLPEMTPPVAVNLYRICQEIIANTIKHSAANELAVSIQTNGRKLVLETSDNGKGFDVRTSTAHAKGYGLVNLHNRTEMLGGELFVESAADKGTRYRIEIPV